MNLSRIFLVVCLSGLIFTSASASEVQRESYEPAVQAIIQTIQEGDLESALNLAEFHIADFPKSRIGYLLKADILQAMSSELIELGQNLSSQPKSLGGLKHQLKNRWQHTNEDTELAAKFVPASLVYMGRHEYVLVNDLSAGRLYLYKNVDNRPVLVRDYYLSIGTAGFGKRVEGDNKTPVGVYSINQFIHTRELPDLYGDGAFPVDYPNRLDRAKSRTGYGIWLHGTPSATYARKPWASRGCFVVSNDDFNDIKPFVNVKRRTPAILSDGINWIGEAELGQQRAEFLVLLDTWQSDLADLKTDAYLTHYARKAHNFGRKLKPSWDSTRDYYTKPKQVSAPIEPPREVETLPPMATAEPVPVGLPLEDMAEPQSSVPVVHNPWEMTPSQASALINPVAAKPVQVESVETNSAETMPVEEKPVEKRPLVLKPTKVSIRTTIESVFVYPGEHDLFVVQSKLRLNKDQDVEWLSLEQYWQRNDNGQWQIIYEGQRG